MNYIIVLYDGWVVEEGIYVVLLNEYGYYYDLINSWGGNWIMRKDLFESGEFYGIWF